MSTFAALLVVAVFAYLLYRYVLRERSDLFRLERFRPSGSLTDWTRSYYDDQRQYADLAAVYGRGDAPDPDLQPALAARRETLIEAPVSIEAARQVRASKAERSSFEKLDRPA